MLAVRTGNLIAAEYMNFLSRCKPLSGLRHRHHVIEIAEEVPSAGSLPGAARWRLGPSGGVRSGIDPRRFARQSSGIGPCPRHRDPSSDRAADPRFRFGSMDWGSVTGHSRRRPQVEGRAATESAV